MRGQLLVALLQYWLDHSQGSRAWEENLGLPSTRAYHKLKVELNVYGRW